MYSVVWSLEFVGVPVVLVRYGYSRVPFAELPADIQIDEFGDLPAALATFEHTFGLDWAVAKDA